MSECSSRYALSRAPAKNYDVYVVSASDEQNEALIRAQVEQRKDGELSQIINYLVPKDAAEAKKTEIKDMEFCTMSHQIFLEGEGWLWPQYLWKAVLYKGHDPVYRGKFSTKELIHKLSLVCHWPGMRGDVYQKCASCVICASTQGQERRIKPLLYSIPVHRPFYCIRMGYNTRRWN